jgi:hypothetical protein
LDRDREAIREIDPHCRPGTDSTADDLPTVVSAARELGFSLIVASERFIASS